MMSMVSDRIPVVRVAAVYGPQPGSPVLMKFTHVEWAVSATAWDGVSPMRGAVFFTARLSKTKGTSTRCADPSPPLAGGSG